MRCRGFTYVGVLIAVATIGVVLAAAGSLWTVASKRDREAELLFVGDQFRKAIVAYRNAAPAGQPQRFPEKLEDLVHDKRWPVVRRHLRKRYFDPITASHEWGLLRAPDGGIMAVYSLSSGAPLKRAGFPEDYESFEKAKSYRDWVFAYVERRGVRAEN